MTKQILALKICFASFICYLSINQGHANAVLLIQAFQEGNDVVINASGSLELPKPNHPTGFYDCPSHKYCDSYVQSGKGWIGMGPSIVEHGTGLRYNISNNKIPGLTTFGNGNYFKADTFSGDSIIICSPSNCIWDTPVIVLRANYISNSPIISQSRFTNKTLSDLGFYFTGNGIIGTYTLESDPSSSEPDNYSAADTIIIKTINPPESVPAPLGFIGPIVSIGFIQRLRRLSSKLR